MPSIFTKIVNREIPSYTVAEDDNFIAFLDINPLSVGHTLIVPKKKETDYFFDLDEDTLSSMMVFSKRVAAAIRKSVKCKRVGVAVIGFEIPHAHLHLVPMNGMNDINFANPKLKLSKVEFEKVMKEIHINLT
ncbi:MAG: HIT family protein [Bacteroidetes bacterium]|nr:HIT family protein [Bacteroidota bacterium]MBI3482373.1 HIT family protein [Bacteroidota bacterium]